MKAYILILALSMTTFVAHAQDANDKKSADIIQKIDTVIEFYQRVDAFFVASVYQSFACIHKFEPTNAENFERLLLSSESKTHLAKLTSQIKVMNPQNRLTADQLAAEYRRQLINFTRNEFFGYLIKKTMRDTIVLDCYLTRSHP